LRDEFDSRTTLTLTGLFDGGTREKANEDLSVVIPMYNEEETADKCINRVLKIIEKVASNYELIIVDDGSKDGTWDKIQAWAARNAHIQSIKHTKNLGVGVAFLDGFKKSKGKYIVTLDADLSYPPEELPKLLHEIHMGYDVVLASCHVKGGKMVNVPFFRKLTSRLGCIFYKIILKLPLITVDTFFAVYPAEIVKELELKSRGFDLIPELIIKLWKSGYKITEVPTVLTWEKGRKSKIKLFTEVFRRLKLIRTLVRFKVEN